MRQEDFMSEFEPRRKKLDDYQKALELYSKAMGYFHKRDFTKAIELFKEITTKYSSEKEVVDRANLYLSISENRLKGKKIELKSFDDYFYYGIYKLNSGEYDEAIKFLKIAQNKAPNEGKIYYMLANAFILKEDNRSALDYLKQAIRLDSFFKILAQNEVDFEPLRQNKEFQKLVK